MAGCNQSFLKGVVEPRPRACLRRDWLGGRYPARSATGRTQGARNGWVRYSARAAKPLPSLGVDWRKLVIETIQNAGHIFDPSNERHSEALKDQAEALERITTRKLSVLVGRAGTGKTSALGALLRCRELARGGILLLAPTGKARVILGRAAQAEANTVAGFLYHLGRFDGEHSDRCSKVKYTVRTHRRDRRVLHLTDDHAVLAALDKFMCGGSFWSATRTSCANWRRKALCRQRNPRSRIWSDDAVRQNWAVRWRVEHQVRATKADALTLHPASWFTREQQPADADRC